MSQDEFVDEEMEGDPELKKITNAIIGAAIAVHKELGPGYDELTYENSLAIEFGVRGIKFERQYPVTIYYRGQKVGDRRLDFLVEGTVVVELKAVEQLIGLFTSQTISYLKASKKRLALLINFNVRKLTEAIRRIKF
jgi:GxxExxY protein